MPSDQIRTAADHESTSPNVRQLCESRIYFAFGTGMQDLDFQPKIAGCCPHISFDYFGISRIGLANEQRNNTCCRNQLAQQFQPLRCHLHVQLSYARDVTARSVKAGDEAKLDRVAANFEGDRNGPGRCLGRDSRRSCERCNYSHLAMHQIRRQCGQAFVSIVGKTILDSNVLSLYKTRVFETLAKRS